MDERVKVADAADAGEVGRLLDAFNREYDEPTPGAEAMARRVASLMGNEEGEVFLLAGSPPVGVASLRFRPALWAEAPEAWLAELYVSPSHRGRGLGRAMLEASLEIARSRGAAWIHLATSEGDRAARALYESCGFTNLDDGAPMFFYERDL